MRLCSILWLLIAAAIPVLGGCASMIHGTDRVLTVATHPPGAKVKVDGTTVIAPGAAHVVPSRVHTVVAVKEGYRTASRSVKSRFYIGSILADVLLTGMVGLVVDSFTGGWYYPEANHVEIALEPVVGRSP
ncbi:MAG: PEGA domain-containing protein [Nitrospirae bacterium]|nr:PEGA domain-containing protein [Nitrospirota bacterium]